MPKQLYRTLTQRRTEGLMFNPWDILALLIIFSLLAALGWGAAQMASPYQLGDQLPISLDPSNLPMYAIRSTVRMLIALCFSLLFTFTVGTWAAKSKRAARIIVPLIDILQSVPVLSFLSITIVGFIALFPNSLLGPECAAILAIFTAQVWNITLGFYQSLKNVPHDLKEAADMFHLSKWQRFWRIEVPFSMSSLLWNTMMSMSASWFFVVLCEAISVSGQNIRLPGIGSYIALAIDQKDKSAILAAILTMLIVILLYDQLLFRPLLAWSEKFKFEQLPGEKTYRSWLANLIQRTKFVSWLAEQIGAGVDAIINLHWLQSKPTSFKDVSKPQLVTRQSESKPNKLIAWLWRLSIIAILIATSSFLIYSVSRYISWQDIFHVFFLGTATSLRVIACIIISSVIWIPIGVWIGRRPEYARTLQPIIQFLAAFPASLIYPVVVMLIVQYNLNVEIWVTPLMILGTQWYILFNVIAGATSIPKDIYQAADNMGVKGWHWWRRVALPGIFPYFITGAITAAGGAWNASIVAEWARWGDTILRATGLGEYITAATLQGNFTAIALGTATMCLFVLAFNRILWQPLYRLAEERFSLY